MATLFQPLEKVKTYLIKAATLALIEKASSEWLNLEVWPPSKLKLTRGTAKSKLEFLETAENFPFKLCYTTGQLAITIFPGRLNREVPEFHGVSLDPDPPTNVPVENITGTTSFWLKCVGTFATDPSEFDTYERTVESTTSDDPPGSEDISPLGFTSYDRIGRVVVTLGVITRVDQDIRTHVGVESFGNINNWWRL